jgi:hypothetical protein
VSVGEEFSSGDPVGRRSYELLPSIADSGSGTMNVGVAAAGLVLITGLVIYD